MNDVYYNCTNESMYAPRVHLVIEDGGGTGVSVRDFVTNQSYWFPIETSEIEAVAKSMRKMQATTAATRGEGE